MFLPVWISNIITSSTNIIQLVLSDKRMSSCYIYRLLSEWYLRIPSTKSLCDSALFSNADAFELTGFSRQLLPAGRNTICHKSSDLCKGCISLSNAEGLSFIAHAPKIHHLWSYPTCFFFIFYKISIKPSIIIAALILIYSERVTLLFLSFRTELPSKTFRHASSVQIFFSGFFPFFFRNCHL